MMPLMSLIFKLLVTFVFQYRNGICINVNSVAPGIKLRTPVGREEHSAFPDYKSFAGGRAELPCNVTLQSHDDAITLILWYRGDTLGVPIYSVDARHGSLDTAKHFPSYTVFTGNRAIFDLSVRPAVLKIDPVLDDDGMEYRCRVDFRWGRTMSSFVKLNVIVPPRKIVIKNEKSVPQHGLIGPYNEGSDVRLICESEGGKPPPILLWYREHELIDDTYTISPNNITVFNDITIHKLVRSDLSTILTCKASNNLTKSLSASLTIDINLKPIDVEIITARHSLSANREVEMVCDSRGSRPPAQITWYKDNREMTHSRESISHDGNMTTSMLKLIPSADDHGSYLSCRAENLRLANSTIEDGWKLNVLYAPNVSLLYKSNQKALIHINVGEEILMECHVKANPIAKIIHFLHNGIQLISNAQAGIIINNSTLVITNARSIHKGTFQCMAINSEGKGFSDEFKVKIYYAPTCAQQLSSQVFVVALYESIRIECSVDASPTDVSFYWRFNQSIIKENNYKSDGLLSTLLYTPKSPEDFGIIQCEAKNSVGSMREKCSFTIIAAGPPSSVSECITANRSTTSMIIECIAGYDGGLQQMFHLEVFNMKNDMMFNETYSEKPLFKVRDLFSGSNYLARVYSTNSKGKISDSPQQDMFDVLVGIIIGLLFVIILLAVIIVIICKIRTRDEVKDRNGMKKINEIQSASVFLLPKNDSISNYDSTRNPDLIPQIGDTIIPSETIVEMNHSMGHLSNGDVRQNRIIIANKQSHPIFVTNQSGHSIDIINDDTVNSDQQLCIYDDRDMKNGNMYENYPLSTAV